MKELLPSLSRHDVVQTGQEGHPSRQQLPASGRSIEEHGLT